MEKNNLHHSSNWGMQLGLVGIQTQPSKLWAALTSAHIH
jgi:hypothetical protein